MRMKGVDEITLSDFYCLKCGQKLYPIPRPRGNQRGKLHRKILYCPNCQVELNCIEIKTQSELEQFKEDFQNGKYEQEAADSMDFVRSSREWEKHLCTNSRK